MEGNQAPEAAGRDDGRKDIHRYDSFVVRLWSRGEEAQFGRVEIQHVQTDAVATGTLVGLEWVDAEMKRMMGESQEP